MDQPPAANLLVVADALIVAVTQANEEQGRKLRDNTARLPEYLRPEAAGAEDESVNGCCEADLDELTYRAMEALSAVAARLGDHPEDLSPAELRTYLWARSSLAVVTGIRAEALDFGDLE